MKRLLAVVAAAMLALTGLAVAGNGAKVYRTKLAPVAPNTTVTGKSHLVDGKKKNNIVTVHAKGLTAGTTYPWHIHAFTPAVTDPCGQGATQGPIVTSFNYGELTGNEDGNGSAKGKSSSFDWGAATNRYYVNIHDPATLTPISCGVLTRKAPKPHPQGKQRGFERN